MIGSFNPKNKMVKGRINMRNKQHPRNDGTKENIVLTGFMGAGKTTVGRLLAARLGWNFIETDEMIERKTGMTISKIFDLYGEAYFRQKESEAVQELAGLTRGSSVISTGGGVVLRRDNISALRRAGVIVYLEVSPEEAWQRLRDKKDRPLLQEGCAQERIRTLLQGRRDQYLESDFHIKTAAKNPEEIVEEIVVLLQHKRE